MVSHLVNNKEAALFAGMSLGKTSSTLYALNELFCDGAIRGALIVAPVRVCNLTWPSEVRKWEFCRWMKVANLRTKEGWAALVDGTAEIYLTNYEQLPKLAGRYLLGKITRGERTAFDVVVYDEITMAKNPDSKRINYIRNLIRKCCTRHWGLTGTPAPNSLLDLFAQVRLLDGGVRLGHSYHAFRQTWFRQADYQGYKWEPKANAETGIYRKLDGFAMSLKTSDYLDIPDMHHEDVEVTLPPDGRKVYNDLEKGFFAQLEEGTVTAANSAVNSLKLLQVTGGNIYHDQDEIEPQGITRPYTVVHDAKVKATLKLLQKTGNTLVVYWFKHELEQLRKALPDAEVFMDAKGARAQEDMCQRWNDGKIKALLVHPASMSHGLNLQGGGSDIIWFTPTYSREKYDQLNCRLARRGQANTTCVYRLVAKDTIDYPVLEALREKGNTQERLLNALRDYKQSKDK